jgi:hypothetical protein
VSYDRFPVRMTLMLLTMQFVHFLRGYNPLKEKSLTSPIAKAFPFVSALHWKVSLTLTKTSELQKSLISFSGTDA